MSATKTKRDGFGKKIRDDVRYYVQDTRSVVGNCALFWGKDRSGYVCGLHEAGIYTADDVRGMDRKTDIPWPESFVREVAISHVRVERLSEVRPKPKPRKRAGTAVPS